MSTAADAQRSNGRSESRPRGRRAGAPRFASRVPLAWRNICADKRRLAQSAAGIGFAVLLMMLQLAFLEGFRDSAVEIMRRMDGDVFLTSATKYRYATKDPFSRRQLYAARAVAGVEWARPAYAEFVRSVWKNPQDRQLHVLQVLAFDPDQPVFLIPEIEAKREALKEADTALFDRSSQPFFGTAEAGTESELARRNLRIIGTFTLGPNFSFDGTLVTADRTFVKFFATHALATGELPDVEFGAIKVRPGYRPEAVRDELRRVLPQNVAVRTRSEFLALESDFQDEQSPVGPIFMFGTLVGFAVGMMISYQILFTEISELLPQYATLKAMGYGHGYLARVTLEQTVFYAFVGLLPAWLATSLLCRIIGAVALLPLHVSGTTLLVGASLTLAMCVISGLLALRPVLRADPAELFR